MKSNPSPHDIYLLALIEASHRLARYVMVSSHRSPGALTEAANNVLFFASAAVMMWDKSNFYGMSMNTYHQIHNKASIIVLSGANPSRSLLSRLEDIIDRMTIEMQTIDDPQLAALNKIRIAMRDMAKIIRDQEPI